jgi:hypothetical protein
VGIPEEKKFRELEFPKIFYGTITKVGFLKI